VNPSRRRLVVGLAAGFAAASKGWAQKPARSYRLGFLQAGRREDAIKLSEDPFLRRLGELGYAEGRNLAVERRYAGGKLELLPALAAELVAQKPDLIFAPPAPATAAAKAATSAIPIVFCFVSDPVGLGFAQTLARPGGNLTGTSNFSVEIVGKRIEFLRQMAPRVGRLAIWFNPDAINDEVERRAAEQSAARMGMQVLGVRARNPAEFADGEAATRAWGADCIYFNSNPTYYANRKQLVAIAAALKVPAVYFLVEFADDGGLFVYAANFPELARRAANYADLILRGAKPGDLPVEQPIALELTVNLTTARELGLTIPQSILLRASRVIGGP
jgi:putative ABC transport system substrate-binding protein